MRLSPDFVSLNPGYTQRAFDHGADERAAIGAAGVNVVRRIDGGARRGGGLRDRCLVDRAAVEDILYGGKAQRPVGNADDADMGVARPSAVVLIIAGIRPSIIPDLTALNVPIAAAGVALLIVSVRTALKPS